MASLWGSTRFSVGSAQSTQQEGEEQSVSFPCCPALQSGHCPHLPSLDFPPPPQPGPLALPGILRHCQVGLFHQGHWARERVPGFTWSQLLLLGIDAAWRAESKSPIGHTQGTAFWEWRWPLAPCASIHPSGILECEVHEGKTDDSLSNTEHPELRLVYRMHSRNICRTNE